MLFHLLVQVHSYQGSYPFPETNFQDFSRTQIEFSTALKFSLTPSIPNLSVNSPYCLPYTSYFLAKLNRFPELSRTSGPFPGLKCHNKIPGLSRFSRTHTNPVLWILRSVYSSTISNNIRPGKIDLFCCNWN